MDDAKKNPFQKLETQEELPDQLKDKVLGSIGFGQLVRDFTELFTAKAGETALELFNGEVAQKHDDAEPDAGDEETSKG